MRAVSSWYRDCNSCINPISNCTGRTSCRLPSCRPLPRGVRMASKIIASFTFVSQFVVRFATILTEAAGVILARRASRYDNGGCHCRGGPASTSCLRGIVMSGPLQGVKVVEMSGLGPAPFACMMLADLGAEVICVDRLTAADTHGPVEADIFRRGKRSMALDLKQPSALQAVLQLIDSADVVVEGFRPGVMERLGLGPQVCLARNSRLVYGRMTGWGQSGPMAAAAGHDINYIALSGALHAIGTIEQPIAPLNLVGDFGGGGMLLAVGVLAAVLSARATGKGQVVDAAMTDGSALLMTMIYGWKAAGQWVDRRGVNMLDGGAHFYGTYQCSDGKWIAVGSIEPQFYALLVEKAGLQGVDLAAQRDSAAWPQMRERLAEVFARRSRDGRLRRLLFACPVHDRGAPSSPQRSPPDVCRGAGRDAACACATF